MKKSFAFCLMCFLCLAVFSEVIAWKGQEFGHEENPHWLAAYLKNKNEKPLRKKFALASNEIIFCGIAKDSFLENARYMATLQCQQDAMNYLSTQNKKTVTVVLQGMEFITEFWVQSDDGVYTMYAFYKLRDK